MEDVIPIYKKGDKSSVTNYRPVSLLSCCGKLLERIFKHMYNFFLENSLLYKYQSGILPKHSTTFQLVDIYHHTCQSFDSKQFSCMVFCDISKAFDRVWHKGLLFKLRQTVSKGLLSNGFQITSVENHKHLGITFSQNGHWNAHIETILRSSSKVLGIMRKLKFTLNRKS